MRSTAQKLEACFTAEMLRAAGLHSQGGTAGGGVGETQFSSFLIEQQAKAITTAGGLNLTDCILSKLLKAEGAK
nr:hypothetical protein [Donghicola mangrovi]